MILDDAQIDSLAPLGTTREFDAGEYLVVAGAEADEVHVVVSGAVEVILPKQGGEAIIGVLGRGAVVGEIAVVAGGTRIASARCTQRCASIAVPVRNFALWLDDRPELAHAVLDEARRRIDQSHVATLLVALADAQDAAVATEVARHSEIVQLKAGQTLFEIGDDEHAGYLVLAGRLSVTDADAHVKIVGREQFVGTDALIDDVARSSTVTAVRETTVARLRRDDLLDIAHVSPRAMLLAARVAVLEARDDSVSDNPNNVAVVIAVGDVPDDLVDIIHDEIARHGTVEVVSSEGLSQSLGRPGIAQADPDSPGLPRLSDHLHSLELERDHVLYLPDAEPTPWTKRALERADRVLIVISNSPTRAEQKVADAARNFWGATGGAPALLGILHPDSTERPSGTAELMDRFGAARGLNARRGNRGDLERWARALTGHGVGLVLSGGGGKGFAHIGAARSLRELGVPIDAVGGSSIGGAMAAAIALDLASPDETEAIVSRQFHKLMDYTLPFTSVLRGKKISTSIAESVGGLDMTDFWIPFYVVSTNLTQSRLEIHDRGDCANAIRATVAIPGVLPPVPHKGDLLIDGGVLDNLPARHMRDDPTIGTVIAVDVAPPFGPRARSDYGHDVSGFRTLLNRVRGNRDTPEIASVLIRTMLVAAIQDRNALLEEGIVDLHLDLDLKGVSLLDFERVHEVAAMGQDLAHSRICDWLSSGDAPSRWSVKADS